MKLQYTHNFGSSAFVRVYGYTYYSDWLQNGPQTSYADFAGCCSPDYELSSHTRGGSIQFQDQINAQNLVSLPEDYTTANSVRDNNSFYAVGPAAFVVNAAGPDERLLLRHDRSGGAPRSIATATPRRSVRSIGLAQGTAGGVPDCRPRVRIRASRTTQCAYLLAENGNHATYNQVVPQFWSSSLTDEFRPTDKWLFNLGIRLDSFTFDGSNTDYGAARDLWTNAFNLDNCVNNVTGVHRSQGAAAVTAACPAGQSPAFFQNVPANFTYNIWQPRICGTYTVNPTNVIRFSYGRYTQAPNSAFEQYNIQQEDLADYIGNNFYAFGRTTPGYPIATADLDQLRRFVGTSVPRHGHVVQADAVLASNAEPDSAVLPRPEDRVRFRPERRQPAQPRPRVPCSKRATSRRTASQVNSRLRTRTRTSSTERSRPVSSVRPSSPARTKSISQYNAYTKACAPGGAWFGKTGYNHVPLCGATNATARVAAAPCYTTAGVAVMTGCTAADVGNPYWNSPQTSNRSELAVPDVLIFPGGVGSSAAAYGAPYVATLLVNYKHDKFAVTPSLQFAGGGKYGAPQSNPGIDPAACTAVLPGVAGYNGGGRYDAQTCGALTAIPDTYTGDFDGLGAFTQPNIIAMNMQFSYDVSPRVQLVGHAREHLQHLLGRHADALDVQNGNVCGYALPAASAARSFRSATSTIRPATTDRSFNRS